MNSAFPQQQSHDVFSPGAAAVPVEERGTHIPAFYVRNPHHDPDLVVKLDNIPIKGVDGESFTISQVAPERRWAVLTDGNLMSQTDFNEKKKQTIYEFYAMLKGRGNAGAKYEGNIDREPIPDVVYYVSWRVDPEDESKLLEIGYDPRATDGSTSKHFFDQKGEQIIESRLEILCNGYASAKGRAQMTATERAEVELHLGLTASAGKDEVASKLEVLTSLHKDGKISSDDYLQSVSDLSGAAVRKVNVGVSDAKQPTRARCGKADCKGIVGLKAHERKCERCQEIITSEKKDITPGWAAADN